SVQSSSSSDILGATNTFNGRVKINGRSVNTSSSGSSGPIRAGSFTNNTIVTSNGVTTINGVRVTPWSAGGNISGVVLGPGGSKYLLINKD
ncbi:unnamed protein product, partial [Allacma fusca]